ncbi:MAG: hypothetical protein EAX96_12975 [Candidatus Lokiarchaeota archaeon]|nr:hypothetical protein [Candidatus Lokiarchaeota archaeon]
MPDYRYADIPDDIRTKPYLPLSENLYRAYRALGWEQYYEYGIQKLNEESFVYDMLKIRMEESIMSAQDLIKGGMQNPERYISYLTFPPALITRVDLQQGAMKLILGDSVDTTFVVVNDATSESMLFLNAHLEDGIPVDWWLSDMHDEIIERRHRKLGVKLKEIPNKTKNLSDAGLRSLDILYDIRNERAPQFSSSTYHTAIAYLSFALDVLVQMTNYERQYDFWNAVNAKNLGLDDFIAGFLPWPNMLKMFFMMKRRDFILRMLGLIVQHKQFLTGIEPEPLEFVKTELPEIFKTVIQEQWERGLPLPEQTLSSELPNVKDPTTYEKEDFYRRYKGDNRITLDGLGIDLDKALEGLLLDVDHLTDLNTKITEDNILSFGLGRETKYIK